MSEQDGNRSSAKELSQKMCLGAGCSRVEEPLPVMCKVLDCLLSTGGVGVRVGKNNRKRKCDLQLQPACIRTVLMMK
jgi:hypothetical protein